MKKAIVVIGIGEMGSVFARAFLKNGHPVYPVDRNSDMVAMAETIDTELVIVATGESDLQDTLNKMPMKWLSQCVLLQNELLPNDWQQHKKISNPTVISVWFEKKPGMDFKVIVPSPVFGPHAQTVSDALGSLNISTDIITNLEQMTFELVRKNIYILASNICGLAVGGNVGELMQQHKSLLDNVIDDILQLQQFLTGINYDKDELISAVEVAFNGDTEHKCMGRSAPARLQRALEIANKAGIKVDKLDQINTTKN
ncbi:MAG: hypothetical protein ISR69_12195 [Gammaproteobacteria bacterium]|nr:hypothetical protein [Gammaproteobacteria bacterium]